MIEAPSADKWLPAPSAVETGLLYATDRIGLVAACLFVAIAPTPCCFVFPFRDYQ
jgi:hypothetical protein